MTDSVIDLGRVMDSLDRRILRQVQCDCTVTARGLADLCGTTESTALRRLRKLRRDGTIKAEIALVDPARVGRGLSVILSARLEREKPAELEAFRRRVTDHPDVVACYFVAGSWDYVIILGVASLADYDRFLQEMIVGQPVMVATDTQVVIKTLKAGGPLPIDEPTR